MKGADIKRGQKRVGQKYIQTEYPFSQRQTCGTHTRWHRHVVWNGIHRNREQTIYRGAGGGKDFDRGIQWIWSSIEHGGKRPGELDQSTVHFAKIEDDRRFRGRTMISDSVSLLAIYFAALSTALIPRKYLSWPKTSAQNSQGILSRTPYIYIFIFINTPTRFLSFQRYEEMRVKSFSLIETMISNVPSYILNSHLNSRSTYYFSFSHNSTKNRNS